MRNKNAARITPDESAHMEWVKSQPCSVCDAGPPTAAHHIDQGNHYTTIPLCEDCHQGSLNGIHGQRVMWKVMRKNEQLCLNETIARLRKEFCR
jgi:hypothetical protein